MRDHQPSFILNLLDLWHVHLILLGYIRGIHVSSNKEQCFFPRRDNNEIAKIHRRNSKIFFSRINGPLSLLGKGHGPSFEQTWIPYTQGCSMCLVWLKLAQWFWGRRFLNFVHVFSLFHNHLPLEKGMTLHLNKVEFPLPTRAIAQPGLGPSPNLAAVRGKKPQSHLDR